MSGTHEPRREIDAVSVAVAPRADRSLAETILDPERLAALRATGLLDSEVEEVFDRLTRLAVKLLGVPAAFISLVDENRDFYKSACGFGEPLESAREMTGRTFCHYAIQSEEPLVIDDTEGDPAYRAVPTAMSLGVGAYVGVPLVIDGNKALGSFCAIDMKPRQWTPREVEVLTELAASAKREIELRLATQAERSARIEAEKARRTAEEANASKSTFLAMMSHELRTPLNAIGGYADLIDFGIHGPVTPAQSDALGRIKRSSKHLLGLINNVLNFSKVEAGQISYTIETVAVGPLVRDTEAMIKPQMIASGLRYHSDGGDDVLAVRADPEKLRQIVLNLLTNSLKFTESGGEITVEWGETGPTERSFEPMVYLRVRDTGAGIEHSKLQSIFEPFVQVDEGLRRTNDGVGLGLAISRLLAREMSGELVAESELGRGSTFTLTLPRA